MKKAMVLLQAIAILVVLTALWQVVVRLTNIPTYILPAPSDVLSELSVQRGYLWKHGKTSAYALLGAFLGGVAFGTLSACILILSEKLRRLILPILMISQAIPFFALAPILTLWLGFGLSSKITVAILMIYFPVTAILTDGLLRTPKTLLELAFQMRAKPLRILFLVRLPAALPELGSGLKIAAVYAPVGVTIGEWIGSGQGLGYVMLRANSEAKVSLVFAALTVLLLMTVSIYALTASAETYLTNYARGEGAPKTKSRKDP